jgi:hypothetical protein
LDSLWVKTDPIIWIYDTLGFSTVNIVVKGNTNANSAAVETYGDGSTSIHKLILGSNHIFVDTVYIGFSHMSGVFINCDTKMILYGTNGDSTEILLSNPK